MCGSGIAYTEEKVLSSVFLTVGILKKKGAQCEGLDWFKKKFPHGISLTEALASCDNLRWIAWALDAFRRSI